MSASQGGVYSVLDDPRINGRADFFAGLGRGIDGSWAGALGTLMQSDTEIERYNWLGTAPQMSVWEGEALLQELPAYAATLRNIEFLSGMRVQKADLRRDKTGQIRARLSALGMRAALHWETLLSTLIGNGETASGTDLNGKAYDGQAFFDTDHSYTGSNYTTNQSNDLSGGNFDIGTSTAPTADEASKIIIDLIMNFFTLKDDQGEPINGDAKAFTIMVGTAALAAPIAAALSSANLSSGLSNPVFGLKQDMGLSISSVLNPRLSAKTTKVYAFRTDGDIRSLIMQDEVGVDVQEEDPGILAKHINVAATATRQAGYGLWQHACLATLS